MHDEQTENLNLSGVKHDMNGKYYERCDLRISLLTREGSCWP